MPTTVRVPAKPLVKSRTIRLNAFIAALTIVLAFLNAVMPYVHNTLAELQAVLPNIISDHMLAVVVVCITFLNKAMRIISKVPVIKDAYIEVGED